nr:MAG TPA: hypothetical protein [Caudoviricetes sp.]
MVAVLKFSDVVCTVLNRLQFNAQPFQVFELHVNILYQLVHFVEVCNLLPCHQVCSAFLTEFLCATFPLLVLLHGSLNSLFANSRGDIHSIVLIPVIRGNINRVDFLIGKKHTMMIEVIPFERTMFSRFSKILVFMHSLEPSQSKEVEQICHLIMEHESGNLSCIDDTKDIFTIFGLILSKHSFVLCQLLYPLLVNRGELCQLDHTHTGVVDCTRNTTNVQGDNRTIHAAGSQAQVSFDVAGIHIPSRYGLLSNSAGKGNPIFVQLKDCYTCSGGGVGDISGKMIQARFVNSDAGRVQGQRTPTVYNRSSFQIQRSQSSRESLSGVIVYPDTRFCILIIHTKAPFIDRRGEQRALPLQVGHKYMPVFRC